MLHTAYCILIYIYVYTRVIVCSVAAFSVNVFFFCDALCFDFYSVWFSQLQIKQKVVSCNLQCYLFVSFDPSTLCLFMFFVLYSLLTPRWCSFFLWYCCFLFSLHLLHVAKCSSKTFFVLFMWHELFFIHSMLMSRVDMFPLYIVFLKIHVNKCLINC